MPLAVHLNTQVISDLNVAIVSTLRAFPGRGDEIGGILLGWVENTTQSRPIVHIERTDPIESEHRRGPSFDLSDRDKKVLAKKLAWWNRQTGKEGLRPVGFYRTHTRRGLYLDNDDYSLLRNYFPEVYAVTLLVRPEPGGSSVGGFFFWEDGDIHRVSSYQEFPFHPAKLPLVTAPSAPEPAVPAAAASGAAAPVAPSHTAPVPPSRPRPAAIVPPVPSPHRPAANWGRLAIPVAAGLIAGAILYQVVGRRSPGTATQPPARTPRTVETAPVQRAARSDVPPVAPVEPMPPAVPAIEKPSPFIPKTRPSAKPAAPIKPPATPQTAARSQPPPTPTGSASRTETPASTAVVIHGNADPGPAAAPPAPPPPAVLAPITTPARIEQPRRPARHATVTVEPVSGSKIGRVVGRIPVFGRLGRKNNKDFVPARPIRQITPAVPAGEQLEHDVPVDVKVTVDPSGNVASVDTRGGDKELARVAADAARNWQFIPARRNDESVSSELILHFTFKSPASAQP